MGKAAVYRLVSSKEKFMCSVTLKFAGENPEIEKKVKKLTLVLIEVYLFTP